MLPAVRVENSATIGRHIVAKVELPPGLIVLSEEPLACSEASWIDHQLYGASSSVYGLLGNLLIAPPQECYKTMYPTSDKHEFYSSIEFKDATKLKPELRAMLDKFCEGKPELQANLEANWPLYNKLAAIIAFNSICNSTDGGLSTAVLCLYNQASCFNHSCWPNACVVIDRTTHRAEIRTLTKIGRNEQICISYCELYQPKARRIQSLMDSHKFTCGCSRCTKELETDPLMIEMLPGIELMQARQAVAESTQAMEQARDLVCEGPQSLSKAARVLRATLMAVEKVMGPNHCILVRIELMLADVFEKMGLAALLPEAERLYLRALQALDRVLPWFCLEKVEVLRAVLRVHSKLEEAKESKGEDTKTPPKEETTKGETDPKGEKGEPAKAGKTQGEPKKGEPAKGKTKDKGQPVVAEAPPTMEELQKRWDDLNRICFGPSAEEPDLKGLSLDEKAPKKNKKKKKKAN